MTEPITSDMRRDERTRNYRAVRYGMRLIKFPNEDIPPKSLPLFHMKNRLQHYLSYLGLLIAFIVSGFSGSGEVFGAMVSAAEGEDDRGTVSEHVVNGDANYLDDFVTVLGSTPTKPAALAADLADPTAGPALLDFLSGNAAGITAVNRVDRLKAWKMLDEMVDDIGTAWKTDVPTLTKLSDDIGKFPDLENFLKTNPDHFDAWNSIKHLSSNTRGNPITIQRFKEQLDDFAVYNDPGTSAIAKRNTYKGHADGFANSSGGKGGHFPEDVGTISSDGKIIIVDETQPKSLDAAPFSATEVPMGNLPVNGDGVALATGNNRVYIAQYVMDGNQNPTNVISRYRPKSTGTEHTFFPPGMEWDEIMEQFSSALANTNKTNWGGQSNAWEAAADNGMIFRWHNGQKAIFLKH